MKIHVALLSALLAAPSLAQNTGRADTFVLAAGEVSINDLIDRCAAFLDYNILVSPQELAACVGSGGVKLQKAVETDRDGCEELLANLLYRNGLVLTVLDEKLGMLEIIHASGPRGREIQTRALMRTPAQVLARPRLKVPVMTTVPLAASGGKVDARYSASYLTAECRCLRCQSPTDRRMSPLLQSGARL
jgi:hypothetical protein